MVFVGRSLLERGGGINQSEGEVSRLQLRKELHYEMSLIVMRLLLSLISSHQLPLQSGIQDNCEVIKNTSNVSVFFITMRMLLKSFKPMVIHTAAYPVAFRTANVNIQNLPVHMNF